MDDLVASSGSGNEERHYHPRVICLGILSVTGESSYICLLMILCLSYFLLIYIVTSLY
jgi:hypothetical protein